MTSSAIKQPGGRAGRPPEADPQEILKVALRLFDKKGFDAVTMDEIAVAAGISRRTLFRLFPSKADLAWEGLRDVLHTVRAHATAAADARLPLSVVVDRLLLSTLRGLEEPRRASLARRRLRLVAKAPALLNHPVLQEIEAAVGEAVAATRLPAGMPPALAARAIVATLFAALLWWAEHGTEMSALGAARAGLRAIALAEGR